MALGFASAFAAGSMEVARGLVVIGYDDAAVTSGISRTEATMRRGGSRRIGRAIMGIGSAIGITAGISAKMGIDFQNQMRLIQTSAGASAKDVKYLSGEIIKLALSGKSPYGPVELARAMFHLKSIGYDNADAMKILGVAVQGSKAGFADLESTTSALGAAMRAVFGLKGGAAQAHETMATLNGIVGSGNMRLQELISSLGTGVLGAAQTAGVGLKDVGAALAVLVDQGQNANMAATRLRMSFSLMGAPTKKAAGELAKIGLGPQDLLRQMGSGPGGFYRALAMLRQHLIEHYGNIDKKGSKAHEDAFATLSKSFGGGRSAGVLMILLNHLELLRQKYGQINTITKRFDQEVAASNKTAAVKIKEAWAQVQAAFVKLGGILAPIIAKLAVIIGKLASFISRHTRLFKDLAFVLGMIGLQMLFVNVAGRLAGIGAALAGVGIRKAGTSAAAASGEITVLRGLLLGLVALGVITIVVDILFNPKGPTNWLKKHVPGFKGMGDWVDSKVPFLRHIDEAHGLLAPGEGGRSKTTGANPYKPGTALYRAWAAGAEGHKIAPKDLSVAAAKAWEAGHLWRQKIDAHPHGKHGKGSHSIFKPGKATGPGSGDSKTGPPTPYGIQMAEAKAAATKPLSDDIHALDAERQWIEHQLATNRRLTPIQRLDLTKRKARVIAKINTLLKREHRSAGLGSSGGSSGDRILPIGLQTAYAKATTTKGYGDDIKALQNEENWLKHKIKLAQGHKKQLLGLYKELAKVQKEIAADRKKAHKDSQTKGAAIAKEMMAYVGLRSSFWSDFAPDVFHKNAKGKLELGSEPGERGRPRHVHHHKHVTVNQKFAHAGEDSQFANLAAARFIAAAAL